MNAIFSRRSIRKFTGDVVPEQMVTQLLKAAMAAPSAGNQQAWQFMVIDKRTLIDQIPSVHPHSLMVKMCPVVILVCGDPGREVHQGYWVQDCAAATENILIEAKDLGLGTVWLGVYPRMDRVEGLRKLLGIPENIIPFSLVPAGYPDESKEPSERYDPARVHKNCW